MSMQFACQERNQQPVLSGGAVVHTVTSRGDPVESGPERSGAGREAAGTAGGPQRDRLSQIPPAL